MSICRIRVVAKSLPYNASADEKDKNIKILRAIFKRRVDESGLMIKYKEKEYYESKGEKKRRKKKESLHQRSIDKQIKDNLKNNFN